MRLRCALRFTRQIGRGYFAHCCCYVTRVFVDFTRCTRTFHVTFDLLHVVTFIVTFVDYVVWYVAFTLNVTIVILLHVLRLRARLRLIAFALPGLIWITVTHLLVYTTALCLLRTHLLRTVTVAHVVDSLIALRCPFAFVCYVVCVVALRLRLRCWLRYAAFTVGWGVTHPVAAGTLRCGFITRRVAHARLHLLRLRTRTPRCYALQLICILFPI